MKFVRFVFPFLFVRNWVDGTWEFSRPRFVIFAAIFALLLVGFFVALILQKPVIYINTI